MVVCGGGSSSRRITVSILIAVVVGVVVAVAAAARFNGLLRSIGLLEGRAQEQGAATFFWGGGRAR